LVIIILSQALLNTLINPKLLYNMDNIIVPLPNIPCEGGGTQNSSKAKMPISKVEAPKFAKMSIASKLDFKLSSTLILSFKTKHFETQNKFLNLSINLVMNL